jgi:hypothetical protein
LFAVIVRFRPAKRLVRRDGHTGVTAGLSDTGLAVRVSGKGFAYAHSLVITAIFDKIRARVATGRTREVAAAGVLALHGAADFVRVSSYGFRRPTIRWRGPSHPDDWFGIPLRHIGAAAQRRCHRVASCQLHAR